MRVPVSLNVSPVMNCIVSNQVTGEIGSRPKWWWMDGQNIISVQNNTKYTRLEQKGAPSTVSVTYLMSWNDPKLVFFRSICFSPLTFIHTYSVANMTLRRVSSLVYQIFFKLRIHILYIVCIKVHKRCVYPKSLGLIAEVYGKTCNLTDLHYKPVFQSKSNACYCWIYPF